MPLYPVARLHHYDVGARKAESRPKVNGKAEGQRCACVLRFEKQSEKPDMILHSRSDFVVRSPG